MKKDLVVGFISDIHLYHTRTPTRKICEELRHYFNLDNKDMDILFIAGDMFDRLSTVPKEQVSESYFLIYDLLKWAKETDTQIRILEGTPSHDWKQSKSFLTINEISGIKADIAYFPELSIEYNEKFDIYCLYVPDEWNAKCEDTLEEVKTLMKNKGIEKVDISIMHGQFHYQLPEIARAPKHNEEEYLKLTKYYISIGHVHKHSTLDRIIAQGSFSRLSHGEEEPKGYVKAQLKTNGEMSYTFIENTLAPIYKDIDIRDYNIHQAMSYILTICDTLPEASHVRLIVMQDHPLAKNMDELIKSYPLFKWSQKVILKEKEEITSSVEDFSHYEAIMLTKDNIIPKLMERLRLKNLSLDHIEKMEEILSLAIKET